MHRIVIAMLTTHGLAVPQNRTCGSYLPAMHRIVLAMMRPHGAYRPAAEFHAALKRHIGEALLHEHVAVRLEEHEAMADWTLWRQVKHLAAHY
jgi:hypothetical protein